MSNDLAHGIVAQNAAALQEKVIPHELHLYEHGDHGTGLIGTGHPWLDDLIHWRKARKFLP